MCPDCIFLRRGGKTQKAVFEEYTGTYTTSEVTGTDGKTYTLYTLTSSGTLTLGDDVQYWMCGGGAGGFFSGNNGDGSYVRDETYWRSGGGGGGGYFATGALERGTYIIGIGSGGASSKKGDNTTITAVNSEVITANGGSAGSAYNGGAGASGGGYGFGYNSTNELTFYGIEGTSGGLSTYPFGIESLYAHCPGGGGGSHLNAYKDDNLYVGLNGGSNGEKGKSRSGNGGVRGGGNGAKFSSAEKASTITPATDGSFYGAGGGGAGFRRYSSSSYWYSAPGGSGYQGVMYLLIPA